MELKAYLSLLKKHKLILFILPVLAMVATYYFVRYLPDSYKAKGQIVTGLVDQSQQVVSDNGKTPGQRNDEFTNLIETMQLDKVMDQLSYALVLHDLTQPHPFRKLDISKVGLTATAKPQVVQLLQQKEKDFGLLNPSQPLENKVDSLIGLSGYDGDELIKKNLKIYHSEGSDFINIDADTENPNLSAFIVNTLTAKFISYYIANTTSGHSKSNEFLAKTLEEKKSAMHSKIAALQDFKIKHNILDITNESKDVYGQINGLENLRQQANKDVIAYTGALKGIDSRFNPKDRKYLEATAAKVNTSLLTTREHLRVMNNKYLESNLDPKYKKSVDSLKDALSEQISESTDKYISNPLATKDDLVAEKLKMENELELARYGARSLDNQIGSLKGRLNTLVPAEAIINSLERDIDIATKEYLDIQEKYNQANLNNSMPVQLRQLHTALPGAKQPSKKIFLIALSGIAVLILCMFVALLLFYFDSSVRSRDDLERVSRIKVLGELNIVPDALVRNLTSKHEQRIAYSIQLFRNLMRDIRFEIDRIMGTNKIIAVTSMQATQGKTLFSLGLAYTYAMSNKKVLLIDGNFAHPQITEVVQPNLYLEDFLPNTEFGPGYFDNLTPNRLESGNTTHLLQVDNKSSIGLTIQRLNEQVGYQSEYLDQICVIGNKGGDKSLSEITTETNIRFKLNTLKQNFDIIIVETGSLDRLSQSKEWAQAADKTLAVFENNQSIKASDKASLQYLQSINGKMMGWVLNKVPFSTNASTKA